MDLDLLVVFGEEILRIPLAVSVTPLPHYVLFQAGGRRQASWETCLDVVELCVYVCVWSDLGVRILLLLV